MIRLLSESEAEPQPGVVPPPPASAIDELDNTAIPEDPQEENNEIEEMREEVDEARFVT